MSGSSLDGIDLALCDFKMQGDHLEWKIIKAATIPFSTIWRNKLKNAPNISAKEFAILDYELGYLFGEEINNFVENEQMDYIASHGHTIFHFPELKVTSQIGNGAIIASTTGCTVISDFRSMDIGFGGQGAPLAATIDRDLFSNIPVRINLGGISNISITHGDTLAYDICPCNQILNYLSSQIGLEFDSDGILASQGRINTELLAKLFEFPFLSMAAPKSLDNNAISAFYFPLLDSFEIDVKDKLCTCIEFISLSISNILNDHPFTSNDKIKVLFSGGGTKNKFLIDEIILKSSNFTVDLPDENIIDFKEALLMAYLGYLRVNEKPNVLKSATGASKDSIGGAIYLIK